jgi:hypothetical protein
MDALIELRETHLLVINVPGPTWANPLPSTPEMVEQHHAIYRSLLEDGMLISAGRLDGTPVMGLALFHIGVDEVDVRARLDNDEFVKRGFLALDYRRWELLTGSIGAKKGV